MKTKNSNKKNLEKLMKQKSSSLEDSTQNKKKIPNNLKLLIDKNISKNDFYNKDNGKILNVDYIPKELFASITNNAQNKNDNNISQNNLNNFGTDTDFKIYNNDVNISESLKKSMNISSSNVLSSTQNLNPNLKLNTNISKETSTNKRYNEEININNSTNKNINLNSNVPNNDKENVDENNNNKVSNESSTLRNNLSNYNGLSDNFISSRLNISNTLTNNSNLLSSKNEHYLDKIRLRELENKENFLFELEKKRNKNIFDIVEHQKNDFLRKVKEIEKNNMNNNNEYLFKEKNSTNMNNQKIISDNNSQNITYNKDNVNIKAKEEENNLNFINKNNDELFSYFNKMKKEHIKHRRNSNRSMMFNHRTLSSFYNHRTNILTSVISSTKTDINNNNNKYIHQNKSHISASKIEKSQKKKKASKSSNKLSISKNSNTNKNSSSHIVKSLRSNDNCYNQGTNSFKVLNSIRNGNKNISQINSESVNKRKNKFINSKGKEKIQDKFNTYFNCFVPDLYEEQREKLINEKKFKKAKSTVKIKKLDDYIGPNLYNEEVDAPDFGYICYKANKKINPNYTLNRPISSYFPEYKNNLMSVNKLNNLDEDKEMLNVNLRNIYKKYENEKNNSENDIFNYEKFVTYRNKNTLFQDFQNCPQNEYKEESLMNPNEYNTLYNKAFNQFKNYPYNFYHEQQQIIFEDNI